MVRFLAALLLVLCASAPRAAVQSYAWTIDWASGPDAAGTLSFDDMSDASARAYVWGQDALPLPSFITGLPPGFEATGSLAFDGASVIELRGCDDALTFCGVSPIAAGGYSRAVFSLSGTGSAERAVLHTQGGAACDPASGATLDRSCFAFESGRTTFVQVTPIPEPGTLVLLLAGVIGMGWFTRRRQRD